MAVFFSSAISIAIELFAPAPHPVANIVSAMTAAANIAVFLNIFVLPPVLFFITQYS